MSLTLAREFRALAPEQRRAFAAAFFGWMLDGFDFTILTFILDRYPASFTVDNALAGALGTVTLMFASGGRRRRRHRRRSMGAEAPADPLDSLVLDLHGPQRVFNAPTPCCLPAVRSSASAWAASGRRACRSPSSIWPDRLRGAAAGVLQGG